MDTLKFINDSVINNRIVTNDTLVHKVLMINNDSFDFFKMDNPFWYIMALLISTVFTYWFTLLQKEKESITEAKKIMLNKRIDLHEKIYNIYSEGLKITSSDNINTVYHLIFKSNNEMSSWFDKLLNFALENKILLSKNVLENLLLLSNLRQYLHSLELTDKELMSFAERNHDELNSLIKETEKSIIDFFDNENTLDFQYKKITETDYDNIEKRLKKFKNKIQ